MKKKGRKKKKLFAKSFIYRGQIDSLSNQSASNNEESYSFLVHPSFRSRPPFPHHRVLPCLPSLPPSLFPSRFFLGINNFYRPSGRWNGKRRRPFNFSRVWRVLRGFPLRKCKGRNTPCRDIVVTSTSRGRKQELTGAGNLVELMLRPANTTCRTTVNCINFTRKNIALTL